MPHPAAELGLARSWLVSRDLTDREIATLGETALRCATPGLRDVLALRATGGGMTADEVGAHLDRRERWTGRPQPLPWPANGRSGANRSATSRAPGLPSPTCWPPAGPACSRR
ncbi:hypothetical protein BN11_2740002 [Nostocoides australiense Ben110]|uniref:Uncharacterized protein n=1 Tax=Nostocoides australiense Ben110 TaxID=1193182 RepID=W6JVH0_9MICO|nr:hypothetical protein BN11_2740002 [Tetrasphaera australiensis Ben110]